MVKRIGIVVVLVAGCPDPAERFTREELVTFRAMTTLDDQTQAIREAIVRGDLYDARRRAGQLAKVLPPLPDGKPEADRELRLALAEIRGAPSLEAAAAALARTAQVCSECHKAMGAAVERPAWKRAQPAEDPVEAEMARHAMLVDGLWISMISPSDRELREALDVLEHPPGDPAVPPRLAAGDLRVHELASALVSAPPDERPSRYADLLAACAGCHQNGKPAAVPRYHGVPMPNLDDDMEDHFFHAFELQLSVMGGDLDRARLAALKLETGAFEVPPSAEPYVAALRIAAGTAARATSIREAAAATADVAAACGGCHLATGGGPSDTFGPPQQAPPMALHVYGAYWMGYGVLAPDERAWTQGAAVLAEAPLAAPDAPRPGAEATVHELAVRAATLGDWSARATLWGELLAECAACHREVVP